MLTMRLRCLEWRRVACDEIYSKVATRGWTYVHGYAPGPRRVMWSGGWNWWSTEAAETLCCAPHTDLISHAVTSYRTPGLWQRWNAGWYWSSTTAAGDRISPDLVSPLLSFVLFTAQTHLVHSKDVQRGLVLVVHHSGIPCGRQLHTQPVDGIHRHLRCRDLRS